MTKETDELTEVLDVLELVVRDNIANLGKANPPVIVEFTRDGAAPNAQWRQAIRVLKKHGRLS